MPDESRTLLPEHKLIHFLYFQCLFNPGLRLVCEGPLLLLFVQVHLL